ncbi:MAG: ABC transporter permease [Planctomycetota bacterium]|nr:ABC transporter permease [Planctomycetota bacterium]
MLTGPIFGREALTIPRQFKHYLLRAGYVALLFVLVYTTRQATIGFQDVQNLGDVARFGSLIFQVLAFVQLALVLFFALLFTAGNIAQEKDRQTLILLLMTDLRNRELVLGKLGASLLTVCVLLAVSTPVFVGVHLLGGVSLEQIGWALALCTATAFAAGSWGGLVAFWREKTFQTLAISVLGLVLFIGLSETVVRVAGVDSAIGQCAAVLNPFRSLTKILYPFAGTAAGTSSSTALVAVLSLFGVAAVLSGVTILRLRVWNPNRSVFIPDQTDLTQSEAASKSRTRAIWSNPIIWREIRTRAYGRKIVLIKLAYLALAAFLGYSLIGSSHKADILGAISPVGAGFVGLGVLSLMLINAQAVTAFTSERDGKTLELLLVTDVTAKEFIFGKLGGIVYNSKELIVVPLLLMGYFGFQGAVPSFSSETFFYEILGFLVLAAFAAMLGMHSGICYDNSRAAIANSLGTVFFLCIGIFIFMVLVVETRSSFMLQVQSFFLFIGVGSIGLYASLTKKNPSGALLLTAFMLPFLTFYAITEFLLGGSLGVFLCVASSYGFGVLAMLIPAISDFDVALGRTSFDG